MLIPIRILRYLFLFLLCALSMCQGAHSRVEPCLRRQDEPFPSLAEAAQSRALLSPSVFLGTLRSVMLQRDGTVRASFTVNKPLKMPESVREELEVIYNGSGPCALKVDPDGLELGTRYLVFGTPSEESVLSSLAASALPIPSDKRTFRAVKRVLCAGCAKAPSITGLQRVRTEEGGRVRLNCHLAGNPIPWVEWYKDGNKIISKGRIRVKTKRRTSRLLIRKARLSDRGVYECRASNVVQDGVISASTKVTVSRKRPTSITPVPFTSTSTQSSPWTTEPCHTTDFCLNGGTCIFYKDVREYVCHCAEGYVGLRCDYKDVRLSLGEVKNYNSRGDIP